jgi:hypothetical protein
MQDAPQQLRQQADHCRELANSQGDERTRQILNAMALEYEQQARDITAHKSTTGDW